MSLILIRGKVSVGRPVFVIQSALSRVCNGPALERPCPVPHPSERADDLEFWKGLKQERSEPAGQIGRDILCPSCQP